MSVAPFCELPLKVKKMNMVIVCNQQTPSDKISLKINAKCDDVMRRLMNLLDIEIGTFTYKQEFAIGHRKTDSNWLLYLEGNRLNEPCTCVEKVELILANSTTATEMAVLKDHMEATLSGELKTPQEVKIVVHFQEAYGEKPMVVAYVITEESNRSVLTFTKTVTYDDNLHK